MKRYYSGRLGHLTNINDGKDTVIERTCEIHDEPQHGKLLLMAAKSLMVQFHIAATLGFVRGRRYDGNEISHRVRKLSNLLVRDHLGA